MIFILVFVIGCLIIKLYRTTKERDIHYSNYKNCLMVLAEYDPKLKKYLEKDSDN